MRLRSSHRIRTRNVLFDNSATRTLNSILESVFGSVFIIRIFKKVRALSYCVRDKNNLIDAISKMY